MSSSKDDSTAAINAQPGRDTAGRRRRIRRGVLMTLVVAGVVWAVTAFGYRASHWPVKKFGVVVPGVLYRSAQPRGAEWNTLKRDYGIRTVIDLQQDKPDADWCIEQREFCRDNGIKLIRVPVMPDRPTEEEFQLMMKTFTDPNCQPVLVHCELGKLRTGMAVAAYRIVVDGWSYEKAMTEAREYKKNDLNEGYEKFLRELERRVSAGKAGSHVDRAGETLAAQTRP